MPLHITGEEIGTKNRYLRAQNATNWEGCDSYKRWGQFVIIQMHADDTGEQVGTEI